MSPHPMNLLSAWTALEVLSPLTFRNPADLAPNGELLAIDGAVLPWESPPTPGSGYRYYYHVVLGTLPYEPAINALLKRYLDQLPERPVTTGHVILATALLNEKGLMAGPSSVVVSGFGWGFPVALREDLVSLANWPEEEESLTSEIRACLERTDTNDMQLPVNQRQLDAAQMRLSALLHLPEEFKPNPGFCIRVSVTASAKANPEPLLLNSFFLGKTTI